MTPHDEVEDMFVLLSEVKRQIPSITAVSSGAIASDYQRLRVESVCSRLGLVSLAFLWKQDQTLLLQEMVNCFRLRETQDSSLFQFQFFFSFFFEFVSFNSFLVYLQIANGIKAILVKVIRIVVIFFPLLLSSTSSYNHGLFHLNRSRQ